MTALTDLQRRLMGWALVGLMLIASGTYCWVRGADHVHAQWDDERAKRNTTVLKVNKASAQVTTQVVTQYVDRVRTIREAGQTIIKEVPVYVDQKADVACPVPDGFVRLWNGANRGVLPGSAGSADAPASAVVLSDIAAQHSVEASQCRETEQQLSDLQDWIRKQQAIHAEAQ